MESTNSAVRIFFLFFDLLLFNISFFMVYYNSPMYNYVDISEIDLYLMHGNISELLAYIIYSKRNYYFTDLYSDRVKSLSIRFVVLFGILLILAEIFLPSGYHKGFLIEYTGFFFIFKVIVFLFIYRYQQYKYRKGFAHHRVAILGVDESDLLLGKILTNNPSLGFKFVGYLSKQSENSIKKFLGKFEELVQLSEKYKLNMMFVTNPIYFSKENTKQLLSICNETGLRIRYILMNGVWSEHINLNKRYDSASYFKVFNPQEIPLDNLTGRYQKRIFDILFSLAVIAFIFSWLFPIIGLIIKLNSKGPIFFKQQRTGINNKTFMCLKFRTMTINKECDTLQAQVNDARITSIGQYLRRTNIDELPQFINVLLGNMSIVGPRPHMLKHTAQYSELIKHYKVRHFVKPGITGWAQVNGLRGLTDELWKMEKRVKYDMEYLEGWNFMWDLKIIFLTVFGNKTYKNAG